MIVYNVIPIFNNKTLQKDVREKSLNPLIVQHNAHSSKIVHFETAIANKANSADLVSKVDKVDGKQLSSNDFTDALKQKLESQAPLSPAEKQKITANENALASKAESNHTHNEYAASNHSHSDYVQNSEKGAANGIATLDANSKIISSQIPKASSANILAGTQDVFIDAEQFKELKDSLSIWELEL